MNTFATRLFVALATIATCGLTVAHAKPRNASAPAAAVDAAAAAKATPAAPSAVPGATADSRLSLARWLLQQDGGDQTPGVPLSQVVEAASGTTLLPVDRKDPADAAFIQRLGGILDAVLPQMNKPDSPARAAAHIAGVTIAFEEAVATRLATEPKIELASAGAFHPPRSGGSYPAFRVVDQTSGKTYYLGVSVFAAADRQASDSALSFHSAEGTGIFVTHGSALLISVETNGKTGKDAVFLNWEVIDLSRLPMRAVMTFEGSQDAAHAPGALLNDGRKGRD